MKRILSSIVVLLIFFSCSINCYAAEYKETRTGDVYGKYNFYSNEGIYTAVPNSGYYELVTDDGVQINVSSSSMDLVLIVHQMPKSETACYEWLKSCIPQSYTDFQAYDIYCINASGERVDLPTDTEITMSYTNSNDSVMWISYYGESTIVPHTAKDNKLTFRTVDGDGYYLLCENEHQSPQTGDNNNLWLWWILLIISAMGITVICIEQRKRKAMK